MKKYNTIEFEQKLIKQCKESLSMSHACFVLGMHFNTFKSHAKRLGVYNINPSGKGMKKVMPKIPLDDIFSGKYPHYPTHKLHIRILKENIKKRKCEICNLTLWNSLPVPLELHHVDGNRFNHTLTNLNLICPNCHAQTSTYRGKNV